MKNEEYKEFLDLKLEDYIYNSVLGTDDFSQQVLLLKSNIKPILDECIRIILDNVDNIPAFLIQAVDTNIITIKSHLASIKDLSIKWPNQNEEMRKQLLNQRQNIVRIVDDYVQGIYLNRTQNGVVVNNNFLSVVAMIKTYDDPTKKLISDFESQYKTKLEGITTADTEAKKYTEKVNEADVLLKLLNEKAREKVTYDYAKIFSDEADKYSHIRFYKRELVDNKKKIENVFKMLGNAEIWFFVSLGLVVFTLYVLFHLGAWFPSLKDIVQTVNGNPITTQIYDVPNILIKVTILSFLVYLVTFSFKQFSINKHLYTTIKHRENAISSYKLFSDTISKDDTTSRHALMIEVAKAIYELSKTGYISEKESGNTSFVELTRLFTKNGNS